MGKIFVISDTHFGHANILKFEAEHRKFKSIEEHDEVLINNWNSVVRDEDIVYHLGDFCYWRGNYDIKSLRKKLNGSIHLIQGNHDIKINSWNYIEYDFASFQPFSFVNDSLLIYYPLYQEKYFKYKPLTKKKYEIVLHGHVHTGHEAKPNPQIIDGVKYINVSCEVINLTPIELSQAKNLED